MATGDAAIAANAPPQGRGYRRLLPGQQGAAQQAPLPPWGGPHASDPVIAIAETSTRLPARPRTPAPAVHQFGKAAAGLRSPARREIGASSRTSALKVEATAQMEVRRVQGGA